MREISSDFKTDKFTLLIISLLSFIFFMWYVIFSNVLLSCLLRIDVDKFYFYNASFNFLSAFTIAVSAFFIHRVPGIRLWSLSSVLGGFIMLFFVNTVRFVIYLFLGVMLGIGLLSFSPFMQR